jgi:hypothetical protein
MSKDIAEVLADYKKRHDLHELSRRMIIPYPTLARILNEYDPYDLGVKRIISFIEAADHDFALLDHIEVRLGRVAASMTTGKDRCNVQGLCRLIKESSDAMEELSKALADGAINPQEASACIKELGDLMNTAMELIQDLRKLESD